MGSTCWHLLVVEIVMSNARIAPSSTGLKVHMLIYGDSENVDCNHLRYSGVIIDSMHSPFFLLRCCREANYASVDCVSVKPPFVARACACPFPTCCAHH
eukprot:567404-Amphidinium_carterae.1